MSRLADELKQEAMFNTSTIYFALAEAMRKKGFQQMELTLRDDGGYEVAERLAALRTADAEPLTSTSVGDSETAHTAVNAEPGGDVVLGRFGHHPDAVVDFEVEVDLLIGMAYERLTIGGNPDLEDRIAKAMDFRTLSKPGELRWLNQVFWRAREIYAIKPSWVDWPEDAIAALNATQPTDAEVREVARRLDVNAGWRNDRNECVTDPALLREAATLLERLAAAIRQHKDSEA